MDRSVKLGNIKHSGFFMAALTGSITLCYLYIAFFTQPGTSLDWQHLLVIGVIYFLICLLDLPQAIYVLIFFCPLQFRGLRIVYGVFSVTDVMILELAFVWVVQKLSTRTKILVDRKILFLAGWLFFSLLSCFVSIYLENSLEFLLRFFSVVAVFLIIRDQIKEPGQIFRAVRALIYSAFFVSLYGLWEYFFIKNYVPVSIGGQSNNIKRVFTFFDQPSATAAYLIIVIPLIVFFVMKEDRKIRNFLYAGILFLSLCCLVITFSRSGWLCFTLSAFCLPLKRRLRVLLVLFIIALVLLTGLRFNLLARGGSLRRKAFRYKAVASQSLKRPFLGYGLGAYKYLFLIDGQKLPPEQKGRSAHSLYLTVLIESGVFAFTFFMLFIVSTLKGILIPLKKIKDVASQFRDVRIFNYCLLSSFFALFLMKFLETGLIKLSMWIMLAIFSVFPAIFVKEINGRMEYAK